MKQHDKWFKSMKKQAKAWKRKVPQRFHKPLLACSIFVQIQRICSPRPLKTIIFFETNETQVNVIENFWKHEKLVKTWKTNKNMQSKVSQWFLKPLLACFDLCNKSKELQPSTPRKQLNSMKKKRRKTRSHLRASMKQSMESNLKHEKQAKTWTARLPRDSTNPCLLFRSS